MKEHDENVNSEVENKKMMEDTKSENRIIKFIKPFVFEGKSYEKIDLSGLDELTIDDMVKVERIVLKSGEMPTTLEMTLSYAVEMATRVSDQPKEFFLSLPPQEGIRLKVFITNFFYRRG